MKFANREPRQGGLGGSPISAERAGDYDYMTYNLWQPFDREVQQNPLTVLDARTLEEATDLAPLLTPGTKLLGGNKAVLPNPKHRWFYVPRMRPDEMLVFLGQKHPIVKGGDAPPGSGCLCPHTSFVDPTAPAGAPGRRSVEARVLAAFPKKTSAKL